MEPMLVILLDFLSAALLYSYKCSRWLKVLIEILKGLINALKLIQPIKDKYPSITYADLFQLASATAIEVWPFPYWSV
jgi:hypothetical protein